MMKNTKWIRRPAHTAPPGCHKHVRVEFEGKEVFVTPQQYQSGQYRAVFLRQHGVALPGDPVPTLEDAPEYFCPNLSIRVEVDL